MPQIMGVFLFALSGPAYPNKGHGSRIISYKGWNPWAFFVGDEDYPGQVVNTGCVWNLIATTVN